MPELKEILSRETISDMVNRMAFKISEDYRTGELVLVGTLKGAFMFVADLARSLDIPSQIGFIGISSYGSDTESSGKITVTKKLDVDIKGKDVLVVEDIVDTGYTLQFAVDYLRTFSPGTLKVCTLIDKKERRQIDVAVDYVCHEVSEGFLVGYGLDYNENYRGLASIYHLKL